MTRSNSATPRPQTLSLLTVGFCTNAEGEAQLIASGVNPDQIWMRGRQAESLRAAIAYLRGRGGMLCVAEDLRVFGESRKTISGVMAHFHVQGVTVRDVAIEESNPHVLTQIAFEAMAKSAGMKNHRTARRRGSLGGMAKAVSAAAQRAAIMADDAVRRLCGHPNLTWRDCAEILGPPFSISTLQRLYR